jgi:hypothetical protein
MWSLSPRFFFAEMAECLSTGRGLHVRGPSSTDNVRFRVVFAPGSKYKRYVEHFGLSRAIPFSQKKSYTYLRSS